MGQLFYIAVDGKQTGPFTIDDLKTKNLQRDTLIWTEGIDNWTKAEYIPHLKDVIRSTPPPLPHSENKKSFQQAPPPIQENNNSSKHFGYELARRRERFLASFLESIIISIPMLLLLGSEIFENPYDPSSIMGWTFFSAVYGAILYPIWGGNLGHRIIGLKVISSEDGSDQNKAGAGAIREALKSVFGLFIVPVIWLIWDNDKQNLYDKVVKTIVVKKK